MKTIEKLINFGKISPARRYHRIQKADFINKFCNLDLKHVFNMANV
jgi:hypothetical protein